VLRGEPDERPGTASLSARARREKEAYTLRKGTTLSSRRRDVEAARKESEMLAVAQMKVASLLARLQAESRREEGQALVEYALIISLIAIVAIGVLTTLGTNVSTILSSIAHQV
jgi:pilus assembly protein Flp/PilA